MDMVVYDPLSQRVSREGARVQDGQILSRHISIRDGRRLQRLTARHLLDDENEDSPRSKGSEVLISQ